MVLTQEADEMMLSALEVAGQIADLKDVDYKNTLAVAVLVELLIEKGLFSRQEFTAKGRELEQATLADIVARCRGRRVTAER